MSNSPNNVMAPAAAPAPPRCLLVAISHGPLGGPAATCEDFRSLYRSYSSHNLQKLQEPCKRLSQHSRILISWPPSCLRQPRPLFHFSSGTRGPISGVPAVTNMSPSIISLKHCLFWPPPPICLAQSLSFCRPQSTSMTRDVQSINSSFHCPLSPPWHTWLHTRASSL